MGIRTAFTERFGIEHPIALAPMGGSAGGALTAAVSNGGGLGLLGGGRQSLEWIEREVAIARAGTDRPFGIGLLSWATDAAKMQAVVALGPVAVMVSFGDPRLLAPPVHEAGVALIVQVSDTEEAELALEAGADIVVAQGAEAGGHSGQRSTFPFVPLVVDLARPRPVLAAGGVADGRGLAAALALGADGAVVGTRFQASQEALVSPAVWRALAERRGADTERSAVFDVARRSAWPQQWPARALRNEFSARWHDHEGELAGDEAALERYRQGIERDDAAVMGVWASEAIDLITSVEPAGALVATMVAEAEAALARIEVD